VQQVKGVAAKAKLRLERARADHGAVDVAVATLKRYSDDDCGFYAAALTYYMFFSIFPLLIFSASALGYLTFLNQDVQNRLLEEGVEAVPLIGDIFTLDTIKALQRQRGTLAGIGLVMALYAGSGGIVALEHALNKVQHVEREPGFLAKRIRSLKWLGAVAVAALVAVGTGAIPQFAGTISSGNDVLAATLWVVSHTVGIAVAVGVFFSAFKLLPATEQSWRDVLPGAVVAGVVFELLKIVGAWYLARGAESRQATFGTFRVAASLLVASYLLAQVTLVAAEINAVLAERRRTRQSSVGTDEGGQR
jgi:YihY family inner membrane protein